MPNPQSNTPLRDPGAKPQFKWLPIDDLFIETAYQRSTKSKNSGKNIGYLVAEFNWASCGALIVCLDGRRKKYAVIDGQHRMTAAKNRGDIKELPCLIVDRAEIRDQAHSFTEINKRRVSLHPLATFRAAVAAGHEMSIELEKILTEAKITIPLQPAQNGETGPRECCAISTLVKLLETLSRGQLKWVLTIIPEAYGDAKGQMRSALIKALGTMIKEDPKLDRASTIAALRETDAETLQETAQAVQKAQGGKIPSIMADILLRSYRSHQRRAA